MRFALTKLADARLLFKERKDFAKAQTRVAFPQGITPRIRALRPVGPNGRRSHPLFKIAPGNFVEPLCHRSSIPFHLSSAFANGVPKGIRTPVTAVKGRCPRPLDDGDAPPKKSGGATRDRTADLLHAMQALSQLSYSPSRRRAMYVRGAGVSRKRADSRASPAKKLVEGRLRIVSRTAKRLACCALRD
jgi:hypothetical protein